MAQERTPAEVSQDLLLQIIHDHPGIKIVEMKQEIRARGGGDPTLTECSHLREALVEKGQVCAVGGYYYELTDEGELEYCRLTHASQTEQEAVTS